MNCGNVKHAIAGAYTVLMQIVTLMLIENIEPASIQLI